MKALSPLSKFFGIPWEVPIDPMHQIFLGAAKTLAQVIISKVTKNSKADFESNLLKSMIPYENLHKAKSMKEVKYWKAADFRLFFFHIGPLLLRQNYIKDMKLLELFNRLSLAIRFLSEHFVTEYLLSYAENFSVYFFCVSSAWNCNLSFIMHTIRQLIDQVKKIGPLWLVSAFPFESANHMLTRTVKGSIKNPDKLVHNFLLQQRSLESKKKR